MGLELPLYEELITREGFPTRSKYYPSQSAKTLSKEFFELNPPTVLDPGHTITNLSADQMIRLARAVGLEVTLASYGLLKDLFVPSKVVEAVSSRGHPEEFPLQVLWVVLVGRVLHSNRIILF